MEHTSRSNRISLLVLVLCVALVLLMLGSKLYLANRKRPSATPQLAATPTTPTSDASITTESLATKSSAPSLPNVVAEARAAGPNSLNKIVPKWKKAEEDSVQAIQGESYAQSIGMMADYPSNYAFSTYDVHNGCPTLPESIPLIYESRRFAKLVAQMREGDQAQMRDVAVKQLNADLGRWKQERASGQYYNNGNVRLSMPGGDQASLIWPLTMRINSILLILAQSPQSEDVHLIAEYSESLGDDANAALAGYFVDRVIDDMIRRPIAMPQKAVTTIEEYQQWRRDPNANDAVTGIEVELPYWKSLDRPGGRFDLVGLKMSEPEYPSIVLHVPKAIPVGIGYKRDDTGVVFYRDDSGGKLELNRQAIEFAKRLDSALADEIH